MNWIVNITLICISQDGADVIIGAFAGNEKRNKLMDFTPAVTKGGMALVIPRPTIQQTNIFTTIWRPFQPQVDIKITQFSFVLWIYTSIQWDYLFFGLVRFDSFDADRYIESLYGLIRCIFAFQTPSNVQRNDVEMTRLKQVITFIFGLIVGQGIYFVLIYIDVLLIDYFCKQQTL